MAALFIAIDPILRAYIFGAVEMGEVIEVPGFEQVMDSPPESQPRAILCGVPEGGTAIEQAQALRLVYPNVPAYFVTYERRHFDRASLRKNGFSEAFLLPFEANEFTNCLKESLADPNDISIRYRPVRLLDLEPGTVLDFATFAFLPLNKKYIRMSSPGHALRTDQVDRLKNHDINMLYILRTDEERFYKLTAQQLEKINKQDPMSETEREEKARSAIRSILGKIFKEDGESGSFDEGKEIIRDCQEIVKSYVENVLNRPFPILQKVLEISGDQSGAYSHSLNVSTFVTLFGIGLRIGVPEHLALAGLLADIGMSEMSFGAKKRSKINGKMDPAFESHPLRSVEMLLAKKVSVPEEVINIILQHHERFDGKGFPEKLSGQKILPEAQLVGVVAKYVESIEMTLGKSRVSPRKALREILDSIQPGGKENEFDPSIIVRLKKLLFEST